MQDNLLFARLGISAGHARATLIVESLRASEETYSNEKQHSGRRGLAHSGNQDGHGDCSHTHKLSAVTTVTHMAEQWYPEISLDLHSEAIPAHV